VLHCVHIAWSKIHQLYFCCIFVGCLMCLVKLVFIIT
jgi:hypothetical protein